MLPSLRLYGEYIKFTDKNIYVDVYVPYVEKIVNEIHKFFCLNLSHLRYALSHIVLESKELSSFNISPCCCEFCLCVYGSCGGKSACHYFLNLTRTQSSAE